MKTVEVHTQAEASTEIAKGHRIIAHSGDYILRGNAHAVLRDNAHAELWGNAHAVLHDVLVGMLLPPKADYVNLYDSCFHLYELEDQRTPRVKA